jgi:hypothetical protein
MGHWRRRRAAAAISLVVGIALLNHPAGLQAAEVAENGLGAEQVPGEAGMARADLAAALRPLIQRLSLSLSHRELTILVLQLREARERAQAGGVAPTLISPLQQSEQLLQILSDLWTMCTTLFSADLTLPCDRLQSHIERFNAAAGEALVKLDRRRPAGICLFCENVCSRESADLLLRVMKASVIERLMTIELALEGS